MGILQRLRSLDDRVLGKPKPQTAQTYRTIFLGGIFGTIGLLVVSAITGEWSLVAGVGGPLAITLGSAIRWYGISHSRRKGRPGGG